MCKISGNKTGFIFSCLIFVVLLCAEFNYGLIVDRGNLKKLLLNARIVYPPPGTLNIQNDVEFDFTGKIAPGVPLPGDLDEFIEEIASRPGSPVIYKTYAPFVTQFGYWGPWEYCKLNRFVNNVNFTIDPKIRANLEDKDWSFDSTGLRGLSFMCNNLTFNTGASPSREALHIGNVTTPQGRISCDPYVVRGVQLRHVPHVGCQDDYGAVNFKLYCARNKDNEQIANKGKGKNLGEWTRELVCPPFAAVCGVRGAYRSLTGSFKNECFKETNDGTGLDGFAIACCRTEDPAALCIPKAEWVVIHNCGRNSCPFKLKEGIFYLPTNPVGMPEQYENLGFSKLLAIDTLQASFEAARGDKFEKWSYEELMGKEAIAQRETQKFQSNCNNKKVEQLFLTCGFYQIKTKVFQCYHQ